MREKGIVTRVAGGKAVIQMAEGPACSRCGLCTSIAGGRRQIEIDPADDLSAGDAVEIVVEPGSRLRASVLIFLVPLLAFVCALLVAEYYFGDLEYRDLLSFVLGVAAAVGAFLAVSSYDRKLRSRGIELVRVEKISGEPV